MKTLFQIAISLTLAFYLGFLPKTDKPIQNKTIEVTEIFNDTSTWLEPTRDVMITLARNKVKGCGLFYQRQPTGSQYTYDVACTADTLSWVQYVVTPTSNAVDGPYLVGHEEIKLLKQAMTQ
jgi:hypothetical protein